MTDYNGDVKLRGADVSGWLLCETLRSRIDLSSVLDAHAAKET